LVEHPALLTAVERLLGAVVPVSYVAFRCPQPGYGQQSLHADDVPNASADECRAVTVVVPVTIGAPISSAARTASISPEKRWC